MALKSPEVWLNNKSFNTLTFHLKGKGVSVVILDFHYYLSCSVECLVSFPEQRGAVVERNCSVLEVIDFFFLFFEGVVKVKIRWTIPLALLILLLIYIFPLARDT